MPRGRPAAVPTPRVQADAATRSARLQISTLLPGRAPKVMQVLVFELGNQTYALPTRHVVRVLPGLALAKLAPSADFIAGVMNYRGAPVPVIDLARVGGIPGSTSASNHAGLDHRASFDTRIVLVDHEQPSGRRHLLGLLAEHVSGVRQLDPASMSDSGVRDPDAPFLGQVLASQSGVLQLIELSRLVPPHVCDWLFDAPAAADAATASLPPADAGVEPGVVRS